MATAHNTNTTGDKLDGGNGCDFHLHWYRKVKKECRLPYKQNDKPKEIGTAQKQSGGDATNPKPVAETALKKLLLGKIRHCPRF